MLFRSIELSYSSTSADKGHTCLKEIVKLLSESQERIAKRRLRLIEEQISIIQEQIENLKKQEEIVNKQLLKLNSTTELLLLNRLSKVNELSNLKITLSQLVSQIDPVLNRQLKIESNGAFQQIKTAPNNKHTLFFGLIGGAFLSLLLFGFYCEEKLN